MKSDPYRLLPLDLCAFFLSNLPGSGLRNGGMTRAEALNLTLGASGLELQVRVIVGDSAKVFWVVDISNHYFSYFCRHGLLDFELRRVNAIQASLNDWLEGGRRTLLYSIWKSSLRHKWESSPEEPSEALIPSNAVVVSALVLLALVYHYLAGNVDRGGSKAYSRSSLDFRDIYVAIVLFLGAYVWIKFREAACRGVYSRKLRDKRGGTKVVYEARLTPPMWNGEKVPRLDLGQFATPQEAHNKFLIAAFYYNRAAGLLDGWFPVPRMSEEERSLTGKEKRKWVMDQAKKVYEDFEKEKAGTALLQQELLEAWDDQVTPEQNEVNVDFSMASLLNSVEHQQPAFASQAENWGLGMAMVGDNHGLECASHSFDGMHEGLALSNGHALGFQEGSALPVPQLPPNTEIGTSLNGSDQLDSLQTLVRTLQQQISDQHQKIQEFGTQILQLQHQQ